MINCLCGAPNASTWTWRFKLRFVMEPDWIFSHVEVIGFKKEFYRYFGIKWKSVAELFLLIVNLEAKKGGISELDMSRRRGSSEIVILSKMFVPNATSSRVNTNWSYQTKCLNLFDKKDRSRYRTHGKHILENLVLQEPTELSGKAQWFDRSGEFLLPANY